MALCDQYAGRLAVLKASVAADQDEYLKQKKDSLALEQVLENTTRFDKPSRIHDQIIDQAIKQLSDAEWVTAGVCHSLEKRGEINVSDFELKAARTGGHRLTLNIPCGEPAIGSDRAMEQLGAFDVRQEIDLTHLEEVSEMEETLRRRT
jgi:hypothetical protein